MILGSVGACARMPSKKTNSTIFVYTVKANRNPERIPTIVVEVNCNSETTALKLLFEWDYYV
jgi:hypothetical protein